MTLAEIVNVQIDAQTQSIPQESFGIPLILGTHKSFLPAVKQYSNITEVGVDFSTNAPEYVASQAVFSQQPRVTSLFIGRRNVETVTLNVTTAMLNQLYNVQINSQTATVNSSDLSQVITATFSANFLADNVISVNFNDQVLGTIRSIIDFDIDFDTNSSVLVTVNGAVVPGAVVWNTNQSDTLDDVAAKIQSDAAVTTAVQTGARQITVTFTNPGPNTVTSVVTSGLAPQPEATISEGGFVFNTDQATTMGNITAAILAASPTTVQSAVAVGTVITVTSIAGTSNSFGAVEVFNAAPPVTVTIVNDSLKATIAKGLVAAITGLLEPVTAQYTGTPDGTFTVAENPVGTSFTINSSTNISSPNEALVFITDAAPGVLYEITVKGEVFQYEAPTDVQNAEQIAANLVAQINNFVPDIGVSAVDNLNGSFRLVADNALVPFSLSVTAEVMSISKGIYILPFVPTGLIADKLDEIYLITQAWYALMCTDRTLATVKAIADWAQAKRVLFGTASNDPNIINQNIIDDVTSIAWYVRDKNYFRTFVLYHEDADTEFAEAAWFGKVLPLTPGAETWKFKTLRGVTTSDLTTTQSNNVLAKKANTYQFVGGVGITQNGTVGSGEFIDIVRGIDWLQSTITTNVFTLLATQPKVPYTDAGITAVQAQVERSLATGVANGLLTDNPAPDVVVPKAANVPSVDKANRILKNVTFTATLAGAIHAVEINGVVTV